MRDTMSLFWRKTWDNLGHVVIFNMIWLTMTIPLFLAIVGSARTLFEPISPGALTGAAVLENEGGASTAPSLEPPSPPSAEAEPAAQEGTEAAAQGRGVTFRWSAAGAVSLVCLAAAWILFCAATGFVFHGMADIVEGYDFSGYKPVAARFLRRTPILRCTGLITLFVVTFAVAWANIIFYLRLVPRLGIVILLLAGIMLWFALFAAMTFMLALPLLAQREATVKESLKTAAIFALTSPSRSFFVLLTGFAVMLLGLMSAAGAGFFAVSAPAILFNADVKVHLAESSAARPEEKEAGRDDGDAQDAAD